MSRILLALATAATVGVAAPAFAVTSAVSFPTLTYPPVTSPDVGQGCADLTTISDELVLPCPSNVASVGHFVRPRAMGLPVPMNGPIAVISLPEVN